MNFSDKIVFITGGSGTGVGSELCRLFAAKNATVIINGRNAEIVNKLCAEITNTGGKAYPAVADITNSSLIRQTIGFYLNKFKRIDILVHNASTDSQDLLTEKTNEEIWFHEINTILSGFFYILQEVIPGMKSLKSGKIVLISSNAGTTGSWGRNIGYAVAKSGLTGMTRRLALELSRFNINVNCIVPSQIDTPRIRKNGRRSDAYLKNYIENIAPMGKIGTPSDVANLVCFLASAEASYITGQQIVLDGGTTLPSVKTQPAMKSDEL